MHVEEIVVPQLGEGLQEVQILKFLKQPNERVRRDEPIYEIETDKSTLEVESPVEGTLREWLAQEGDVVAVGGGIARIETESHVPAAGEAKPTAARPAHEPTPRSEAQTTPGTRHPPAPDVLIPPRSRAYAKELGLSEEEIRKIPASGTKLMPEDIDRFIAGRTRPAAQPSPAATPWTEYTLPRQQQTLAYRLKRSVQLTIPCSMTKPVDWSCIRKRVEVYARQYPGMKPSQFKTFAYSVAQVTRNHPKFRSTLLGDNTVREYEHLNLGIAVKRDNDELVTALVRNADALDFASFHRVAEEQIEKARHGEDQAGSDMPLILTYMGKCGVTDAIPVLVTPAVGVLFIGAPIEQSGRLLANVALTFDHRLINGVGAASFLNAIVAHAEDVSASPA